MIAAGALMAVTKLIQLHINEDTLTDLVSYVEQLMTTGGGWQDQVGGIYGGFKLTESKPNLPLELSVSVMQPPNKFIEEFERRTFLIFTGKQVRF